MAVVTGTSAGICAARPSGDPGGTNLSVGSTTSTNFLANKFVAPTGATGITEIGWFRDAGTSGAFSFDVGIYSHDSANDRPQTLLDGVSRNNTAPGYTYQVWLYAAVSIAITAGTTYWMALQCDGMSGNSVATNYSAETGSTRNGTGAQTATELPATWPSQASAANSITAIYALYTTAGGASSIVPIIMHQYRKRR